jgi:hypothetical protein
MLSTFPGPIRFLLGLCELSNNHNDLHAELILGHSINSRNDLSIPYQAVSITWDTFFFVKFHPRLHFDQIGY